MELTIFAGKGGVGKTTSAVSLALYLSSVEKVAIIDYDGGHSVSSSLGLKGVEPNKIISVDDKLSIGVIESVSFYPITTFDEKDRSVKYLDQFQEDFGIVAFSDMINEFFGVPTDIASVQKFILLVKMITELEEKGFRKVIIDVEPTAGLERLLLNSNSMLRSLRNLKSKSKLLQVAVSVTWPDIARFLKSDYVKNIDLHTKKIEIVVDMLLQSKYVLVCTPEKSPVSQSFEVRKIIENFGGKIHGYVVNNLRDESHEDAQLQIIRTQGYPMAEIKRYAIMQSSSSPKTTLLFIGSRINEIFK